MIADDAANGFMGLFRLLLALSVVIEHVGWLGGFRPLGARQAVETFFIISGFYMALILNEKYTGKGSYRLFITNRFLRIYPAYWCVLVISIGVYLMKSHGHLVGGPLAVYHAHLRPAALGFLHAANLLIFGQDAVLFLGVNPQGHLYFTANFQRTSPMVYTFMYCPPAWTLSLELTFYLLAPWLVRRSARFLGALILASIALRIFLRYGLGLTNDPWTYRFFPTELAFFLAGAMAYQIYRELKNNPPSAHQLRAWLIALLIAFFVYQFIPAPARPAGQWLFYLLAFFAIPRIFLLSKSSPLDRYIGELSYPVYLTHFIVITFLQLVWYRLHWTGGFGIAVVIGTLAASMLLIQFLINPIDRLRQRRAEKMPLHPPPASLLPTH
jgi:peptidoglycan/LPS O-acetylase OafA/YrhL